MLPWITWAAFFIFCIIYEEALFLLYKLGEGDGLEIDVGAG